MSITSISNHVNVRAITNVQLENLPNQIGKKNLAEQSIDESLHRQNLAKPIKVTELPRERYDKLHRAKVRLMCAIALVRPRASMQLPSKCAEVYETLLRKNENPNNRHNRRP